MDLDLVKMTRLLQQREITAVEVTAACLDRMRQYDPALKAFRQVRSDEALAEAAASDRRGERLGILDGVPVAVKDNTNVVGLVTRSGLGARGEQAAERDADIVQRLRAAGAVILGHLNMHEGGLGAITDNPHNGRTNNPWRLGFTPGGSSGGSAVAVAAGFSPIALGTDTLGSVRLPAAYCGVVGYKPSHGRLINDGIEPLCRRLDQIGPIARSVADLRLFMEALEGKRTPSRPIDLDELRIGRLREFDDVVLSDDVRRAFENSLYRLTQAEVITTDVSIEGLQPHRLHLASLLLAEAEAAHHFVEDRQRFPDAFSTDFATMLDVGARAEKKKILEAEQLIANVREKFEVLFEGIDLLITPTAPQTAFSFDAKVPNNQVNLTALANVAGAPAISLPIPSVDLPVGLQLIGRRGADDLLLQAARSMERDLGFEAQPLVLEEME